MVGRISLIVQIPLWTIVTALSAIVGGGVALVQIPLWTIVTLRLASGVK